MLAAQGRAGSHLPAECSGHGTKTDGVCVCEEGFELEGTDECHAHDDHPAEGAECGGHGTKGADGVCVCEEGFELHGDECHDEHPAEGAECGGHGTKGADLRCLRL